MLRTWIAGGVAALMSAQALLGWGREGHALIGQIAERHLSARARAEVARLLEAGETLASVASWADEVRPARHETSTWHYINIPVTASRAAGWRQFCPETDCVVSIIAKMRAKLGDRSAPREERREALKFLVHFTGDLHQPLHSGDRGDRGGNDVPVVFLNRPSNLHSVWDTPLLAWMLERDAGLRGRLTAGAGYWERRRMEGGTVEDWAWEAQGLSRELAYAGLPEERPAVLDENYAARAAPMIERQIRRAGLRLARLLNETLGR